MIAGTIFFTLVLYPTKQQMLDMVPPAHNRKPNRPLEFLIRQAVFIVMRTIFVCKVLQHHTAWKQGILRVSVDRIFLLLFHDTLSTA